MENSTNNIQGEAQPKTVSAAAVLAALQAGKTRAEIKAEFAMTWGQMKQVFALPGLKGRRTLTTRNPKVFLVVNDLPAQAPVVEEAANVDSGVANVGGAPTDSGSSFAENTDLEETGAGVQEDIIDASASQEEEEQDDRPPFERFS